MRYERHPTQVVVSFQVIVNGARCSDPVLRLTVTLLTIHSLVRSRRPHTE